MIKKTITYDTYDDEPQTLSETFYFALDKRELIEMEIQFPGGLKNHIERLSETQDGPEAYEIFKDVLLRGYGKRSADNKGFHKRNDKGVPYRHEFEASQALGELIIGFIEDSSEAARFIEGMFPAKIVQEVQSEVAAQRAAGTIPEGIPELTPVAPVLETSPPTPAEQTVDLDKKPISELTAQEIVAMPKEQFDKLDTRLLSREQLVTAFQRKSTGV